MRNWLAFYLIFSSILSEAQVSREALFERAFKSLPFFMTQALQDRAFMQSLSKEEEMMMEGIYLVAQKARNRQWFRQKNLANYPSEGRDRYYYVSSRNHVHTAEVDVFFGLHFSDDRQKFKLNPEQPERMAMTYPEWNQNIFINRQIINDPQVELSLSDATALLTHEFGHKLGDKKNQAAVDSLAGKIKQFVDSQTQVIRGEGSQKATILRFKYGPWDAWVEGFLFGFVPEVNHPRQYEALKVFDGEGTYVLVETKNGVHDLTDELFRKMADEALVLKKEITPYEWIKMNWFLASYVEGQFRSNGELALNFNLNHLQVSFPFMRQGMPHPADFHLFEKAYPTSPPMKGVFLNQYWQVHTDGERPRVEVSRKDRLIFENPTSRASFTHSEWQGETLLVRMKISDLNARATIQDIDLNLWPFLQVRLDDHQVDIKASKKLDGDSTPSNEAEYEFKIPGIKNKNAGTLVVTGLYAAQKEQNLAQVHHDLKIKLFLEKTLQFPLSGPADSEKPTLKSIQIWNGEAWTPIERSQSAPGSHLRLIFHSRSDLLSLSLLQSYTWHSEYRSILGGHLPHAKVSPPIINEEPRSQWVQFSVEDLKQTRQGEDLLVDLRIDSNVQTDLRHEAPLLLPAETGSWTKEFQNPHFLKESFDLSVNADRSLEALRFTNQALRSGAIEYSKGLRFTKRPSTTSLCQKIFE